MADLEKKSTTVDWALADLEDADPEDAPLHRAALCYLADELSAMHRAAGASAEYKELWGRIRDRLHPSFWGGVHCNMTR